jgi:hypothetical protein
MRFFKIGETGRKYLSGKQNILKPGKNAMLKNEEAGISAGGFKLNMETGIDHTSESEFERF